MNHLNVYIGIVEIVYKAIEVILLCSCLKAKKNSVATFFAIWIPTSIIQVISAINNFEYTSLSLLMFAVFIGLGIALFENKIQEKVIVSLSLVMICALVSMGYFSFANSRHLYDYFSDDKVGTLVALLVICGIETLFTLIWQKRVKSLTISGKDLAAFTMLPISQILICLAFQLLNAPVAQSKIPDSDFDSVGISMVLLFFSTVVFIITDLLMYRALIRISDNVKETEHIKALKIQDEINFEHYRLLQENSEKVHKIRHDISNIIEIAAALAGSDDEQKKDISNGMISDLKILVNDIENDHYCENDLINTVLCSYVSKCKKEKIRCVMSALVPNGIDRLDTDICRALTNMLDNAIYASKETENPVIEIKIWVDGGYLYMRVINPVGADIKPRKGDHGYGIKILEDIAENNGGSFIVEKENNLFTALITLKIQK